MGGTICHSQGKSGSGTSRLHPTTWGSVFTSPGASVGLLTLRPRTHTPDMFRVYSPSLCLKRRPARQQWIFLELPSPSLWRKHCLSLKALRVVGPRLLIPLWLFAANQYIYWLLGYFQSLIENDWFWARKVSSSSHEFLVLTNYFIILIELGQWNFAHDFFG